MRSDIFKDIIYNRLCRALNEDFLSLPLSSACFLRNRMTEKEDCNPVDSILIEKEAMIDLYAILKAVEFGRFHYKRYDELVRKTCNFRDLIESKIE